MAQWEYSYGQITHSLGTQEALDEMNQFGKGGWEVCSVLADPQTRIVLLKREIPGVGSGGSGGPGGSA
jgi:hypothetical protein